MPKIVYTKTARWDEEAKKLILDIPETPDIQIRRFRAKEVAETYLWEETEDGGISFLNGSILVALLPDKVGCSCQDMMHRKKPCKHVFGGAKLKGDEGAILERMVTEKSTRRTHSTAGGKDRKWRSDNRPQNVRVGKYFMLSDFLYSETAVQRGIPNCPDLDGKEVQAIRKLCEHILDPVVEEFGPLSITYGYVSPELQQATYGGMTFPLHNGIPGKGRGAQLAAAADILVHSQADTPRNVLNFMRDRCTYDRLILYPGSSIICTAWTDRPRFDCKEWVFPDSFSKAMYVNAGRDNPPPVDVRTAPEPNGESNPIKDQDFKAFDQGEQGKLF
jgi:hypothetical protein